MALKKFTDTHSEVRAYIVAGLKVATHPANEGQCPARILLQRREDILEVNSMLVWLLLIVLDMSLPFLEQTKLSTISIDKLKAKVCNQFAEEITPSPIKG
jgi:hypothetical protein